MRELVIRFSEEGERLREINEERNYFFSEAEEKVVQIRKRLKLENRMVSPKQFELWLDGQQIVVTYVSFESKESLEEQLIETILHYEGWEEENKHKYVNKLKDYAQLERQLFLNKEFTAFIVRFDQTLGNEAAEPFPLLLSLKQLKLLFDEVYTRVASGFYSELEEIINAIEASYETVAMMSMEEMPSGEYSIEKFEELVLDWFIDEAKFKKMIQHVSACYQSVSHHRIDSLCSHSNAYQKFQSYLFKDGVLDYGFRKVYSIHEKLLRQFDKKFNDILFEGFVLKSDEMVESLVISPVIKKVKEEVEKELNDI